MPPRFLVLVLAIALLVVACSAGNSTGAAPTAAPSGSSPPAPTVPDGPVDPTVAADLDALFTSLSANPDTEAVARLGVSGDARVAWLLADVMRFAPAGGALSVALADAWGDVT
ncbi:MAG: hypothetical protein OES57_05070, partial [Acidimicrobiia bacterium]|nr:hypothetical protein [Acidimicrobiia bacterium]